MHHKALFDCMNECIDSLRESGIRQGKVARVGRLSSFVPGRKQTPNKDEIIRMVRDEMIKTTVEITGEGTTTSGIVAGIGYSEDDDREWEIKIREEETAVKEDIVDDFFNSIVEEALKDGIKNARVL